MAEFFRHADWPDSTEHSVAGSELPRDRKYYRAIWISDFHLGTARCKAEALLDFLQGHAAETLYLVGDVIDGWNIGPGWCWNAAQTAVVEEIWGWRRRGTRIVFLPGNHDERNLDMVRTLFGQIECVDEIVHRTEQGRRMLVIHGHQFGGSMHLARWLSRIGSVSYSTALRVNLWYNREQLQPANRRRIANAYLRRRLKTAVHYLTDFEDARVLETAAQRKVDGVICGHTHRPARRMIGPILYVNDGDWVQSHTALVEERDGHLRLIRWGAEDNAARASELTSKEAPS